MWFVLFIHGRNNVVRSLYTWALCQVMSCWGQAHPLLGESVVGDLPKVQELYLDLHLKLLIWINDLDELVFVGADMCGYDSFSVEPIIWVRWGHESESGVEKSEIDLFWCISMTNNMKSCRKINGRVQTFRFSVFSMGRQELCAENA